MNKLWHLIKGELFRLVKYKILFFGVLVSAIWVIIIGFSDIETVKMLLPFLVLMDAGLMSIILLAASFYLEKQEGTMNALLVSPVSLLWVLIAKIVSTIVVGTISFVLVVGAALIFHEIELNVLLLFFYMVIIILSHTAIGFVITLNAKDFMGMLVRYMGLMLLFFLPVLLVALEIIPTSIDFIVLLSPSYAGQYLFKSALAEGETWKTIASILYLILIPSLLYPLVVYKRFVKVAIEG
ncbi:MAG: ABC transporter permease [Firmicutes bacterium]|nr:ABC transporter permease [Bacillota bacterium]